MRRKTLSSSLDFTLVPAEPASPSSSPLLLCLFLPRPLASWLLIWQASPTLLPSALVDLACVDLAPHVSSKLDPSAFCLCGPGLCGPGSSYGGPARPFCCCGPGPCGPGSSYGKPDRPVCSSGPGTHTPFAQQASLLWALQTIILPSPLTTGSFQY
jgi:hypothetical protein